MHINTTRFGHVDIESKDIIIFAQGLIGFSHLRKFVLLDDPQDQIFIWLQSCEESEIAFPVLEPSIFSDQYEQNFRDRCEGAKDFCIDDATQLFSIINLKDDPTQITSNLQAPLLINFTNQTGEQWVLQDSDYPVDEFIFQKLQQRIATIPKERNAPKQSGTWNIVSINKDSEPV